MFLLSRPKLFLCSDAHIHKCMLPLRRAKIILARSSEMATNPNYHLAIYAVNFQFDQLE